MGVLAITSFAAQQVQYETFFYVFLQNIVSLIA